MSWTDRLARVGTTLIVAALAGVAGAISFSHMAALALEHGQTGWKSTAFPVSVDGLELVASLYLLAQRRAGRSTGTLPWVALLVGTAASLAANIAVGGHDFVGRALAGWPAISLLVSLKLLFSIFDHNKNDHRVGDRRTVRDDQRTVPDGLLVLRTDPGTVPAEAALSGTVPAPATTVPDSSATGHGSAFDRPAGAPAARSGQPRPGAAGRGDDPVDLHEVAHLIPAARAARDGLTATGHRLSRDRLADRMREDGHGVSNARAGLLVRILKAEQHVTPIEPFGSPTADGQSGDRPHAAA